VIFVAVFGVMFYSIYAHRKSRGHKAENFHESTAVEIAWTVVPFIIVIVMGALATKTVVAMKDTTNADITIKATGYQWKWGYDYLKGEGEGISFLSTLATPRDQIDGGNDAARKANPVYLLEVDNEVVVPVDKKVRVITTANDVIHAWFVPALGVKQDAIPGFVRDTWFRAEKTGTYYGQCAELCGKDHAFMPIKVRVVTAAEYTQWVDEKKKAMAAAADDPSKTWELAELKARGAKVYAANCQACHQADGQGIKGSFPALDGSQVVANKEQQIAILLAGKGAMPSWKALSDVELAAVATFVRNNWGNSSGAAIQPGEFKAARK
jgi:cytochrome c oxidase subunit 2